MTVAQDNLRIVNERGLHARAASAFVNVAGRFDSTVTVEKDGRTVDGKSILGIVSLLGTRGSDIHVTAEGSDAVATLSALNKLVAAGFDEEAVQ